MSSALLSSPETTELQELDTSRSSLCIADERPLISEGIKRALRESDLDAPLQQTCRDGQRLLDFLATRRCDVLLVHEMLPGLNIPALAEALAGRQDVALIVLTSHSQPLQWSGWCEALNVSSWVSLQQPLEAIRAQIERAARGQETEAQRERQSVALPHHALSEREGAIFERLLQGHSPKEIAYDLDLAQSSVYTYIQRVRRKLDAQDNRELIGYAYRYGLLELRAVSTP